MRKSLTALVFSILIITLIIEAAFFRYIYLEDKEREERKAVEEELSARQLEEVERPVESEENEVNYCVLAEELPVYAEADISVNTESEPLKILKRGELVSLVAEDTPYSLVQYAQDEELARGYVWSDCIQAEDESNAFMVRRKVVVIDAGHQEKANLEEEPIGPGEEKTKVKTAAGTQGVSTKVPENELNLAIALQLEEKLKDNYTVVMVRRTADVNISNKERAMLANNIKADIFIRLHADGSESSENKGAMTICNTANSKYDAVRENYEKNRKLASCILDAYTEATGLRKRDILEKDTYSGINWCSVPVTIVEMGYMTNPDEDEMMQEPAFQKKMVQGIVDGIDDYFGSIYTE